MPIAYIEIKALTGNAEFMNRLQVAIWREASKIMREDPSTVGHAQRVLWAKDQLTGPSRQITEATIRVATTGKVYDLGAAATDADLQQTVGNVVNDLAGA